MFANMGSHVNKNAEKNAIISFSKILNEGLREPLRRKFISFEKVRLRFVGLSSALNFFAHIGFHVNENRKNNLERLDFPPTLKINK